MKDAESRGNILNLYLSGYNNGTTAQNERIDFTLLLEHLGKSTKETQYVLPPQLEQHRLKIAEMKATTKDYEGFYNKLQPPRTREDFPFYT
ncbi:MAG: hypothetical protein LBG52_07690 [Candidatus Peribacteria bacterium]|jgi:hypothetical protein|nr:hypothetical protein [Candidatus Peribacteria bacterium]